MDEDDREPIRAMVETLFDDMRADVRSRPKRRFLRDVQGQICEDDGTLARIRGRRPSPRTVMVSFDRRRRDHAFSYARMDLVLESLDSLCGGSGLGRPVSQLRVLQWSGSQRDLRGVMVSAAWRPPIMVRRAGT
ncbi:hypothetical protein [Sphingomonas sp. CFBP 8760]|uniref:hypothetical protein n=1 Tax=Sphingomonas sp. CFBP 8760 TaxID=2775282 RepID=UPI001781AC47|nr:hypothetical protein [Sphingomonas sp. CFBP 8760]MBD8546044.1 hypothetical protein [Sphingomonas sp. CFBP 8760]